jgi:hypothetical protein
MLNAFYEEKGFIGAAEFSQFAADTVPLLHLQKFVWTTDEQLIGQVSVAHSGVDVTVAITWCLRDVHGEVLVEGSLGAKKLVAQEKNVIGELKIDVSKLPAAQKYQIEIRVGTAVNSWNIWVFAPEANLPATTEVEVFEWYRSDAVQAIREGKRVWIKLNPSKIHAGIAGRYAPAFWSPIHFVEQIGTLGTVIDSGSALFGEFPTEAHSEWHWWEILTKSRALNLNGFPKEFRPLLQIIDRYERNDKLGTLFEARIGDANVLVTFIDFETPSRPAAQQLERSLRGYLNSPGFSPAQSLNLTHLDELFKLQP